MEAATSDVRVEGAIHPGKSSSPMRRLHERKLLQHHVRQQQQMDGVHQPNQLYKASSAKTRHSSKVAPVSSPSSLHVHPVDTGDDNGGGATADECMTRTHGESVVQATLYKWAAVLDSTDRDDTQSENQADSLYEQFAETATELCLQTRTAIALDLVSEMMHAMLPSSSAIADAVLNTLFQAVYSSYDPDADWRDRSLHANRSTAPPVGLSAAAGPRSPNAMPLPTSSMPDVPFCHVSPSHASDAPLDVLDLAAMAQRWNDLVMTRHPNSESVVACVDMLPSDIQQDLAQVLASRWLPDAPSIRRQRQDTASTIRNNDGDSDDDAWGSQDEVDEVPSHVQTSWTSEGEADQVVEDGGGADGSDIDGTSDVMEILLDVYRLLLINNPRAQRQARHRLQSVLLPLVGQFDMRGSDLSELTGTGADNDLRRLVEQLVEDDPIALVDVGLT